MQRHPQTDVCVIGLGAAGSILAAELANAGLSVVGLEGGPYIPREAFESDSEQKDELAHFRLGRLRWNEPEVLAYNDQPPMTFPAISRNIGVGGPLHWSCISYRFHESDFKVKSQSGVPAGTSVEDWPLSYADLEPYYDRAEYDFGVSGEAGANRFEASRSRAYPMPPLPVRPAGQHFAHTAAQLGYQPYQVPAAITTQPKYGKAFRGVCNSCGRCTFYGCPHHAKGVNLVVTLPDALASGQLQVRAGCIATRITVGGNGRANNVVYLDSEGQLHEQSAKVFIASNNAAYVARLLLMSRAESCPSGLANSSGLVGKNLMFHASTFAYGTFPDREFKVGLDPQAAVAFDDLNEDRPRQQHDQSFIRGALISGGIALPFTGGPLAFATSVGTFIPLPPGVLGWGESFKQFLYQYYNRYFAVFALCEDLPMEDNRVELDSVLRDRLGMPVLRIIYRDHENTILMQHFMRAKIQQLLHSAGAREVVSCIPAMPGGAAAGHVMGTTRMGNDPRTSVVNQYCQAHDVANLFIGGGGAFVTSAGVNPTLTIFALAYRTADFIREQWHQGAFEVGA